MIVKTTPTYPHLIKVNNHQNSYGNFNDYGISHDLDKHLKFTRKSKRLKAEIIEKLKSDFIFDKSFKTFLFLASGQEELERFSALQFENIICVDYQIEDYKCIHIADNKRIYTIPTDVITAFSIMKEVGVIVDVLCENNSGENLGFGSGYSLSSQLVLSTGLPIFNPSRLIVITSKLYQKNNGNYLVAKYFYKLGYKTKTELNADNLTENGLDFDEQLLTLYPHSSASLNYYMLENREQTIEKVFNYQGKLVHLIQGNIFDRIEDFDISFLIFRSKYQYTHFQNNYHIVMDARGIYRIGEEIFDFNTDCQLAKAIEVMGCKKIAFIPQNNKDKDWVGLLEELTKNSKITDINFYHINNNNNDFNQLYQLFEQENRD
jgi:hypothetical protein